MADSDSSVANHPSILRAMPSLPAMLGFAMPNAISFQIALGPPLVLMARHWGASSFYIGAIAALVPLLTMTQLYMAPRVEYLGFKRVMLAGWTGRIVTLILTAALPFCSGFLSRRFQLEALFAFMFLFNLLRGLATASWMPWVKELVPERWRGRYLSAEQVVVNISSALTLFGCGWVLGDDPGDFQFGFLFIVSFVAGMTSLYFLKRIDCPPPLEGAPTLEPVRRWVNRVWRVKPFRRLIRLNMLWTFALGAWGTFTVVYLRDGLHFPERIILYMSASSTLGALLSAWVWGLMADRFGSRPVMALTSRLILLTALCWLLLTLGLIPPAVGTVLILYILLGMGTSGFGVAINQYSLNNAPAGFPVLALSLFAATSSFSSALSPFLWGALLDLLAPVRPRVGPLLLHQYVWFYALIALMIVASKHLIRQLPDHKAAATHIVLYHMITDYPLRTLYAVQGMLTGRTRREGPPTRG